MKNFEIIKSKIFNPINSLLLKHDLKIYEINNIQEFEGDVLQILVEGLENPNKPLDFDILVQINEEISNNLDKISELNNAYLLEVASAGLEKKIRNFDEMIAAIGNYIWVHFHKSIDKMSEITGTLEEYNETDKKFKMIFFIKGQRKKIKFNWEDVIEANYRVKF